MIFPPTLPPRSFTPTESEGYTKRPTASAENVSRRVGVLSISIFPQRLTLPLLLNAPRFSFMHLSTLEVEILALGLRSARGVAKETCLLE